MNYGFNQNELKKILNFDWIYYNKYYNIQTKCKIKSYIHLKKNNNIFFKNDWDLIYKTHIELFYKFKLGLENPYNLITYNTSIVNYNKKNIFAVHIHCFNLNLFKNQFEKCIDVLKKKLDIFVTYCNIDTSIIQEYKYINFIKIKNKGLDIGAKMVFVQYLKDYNIDYEYVLFLHSKSRSILKHKFQDPLVNNIEFVINKLNSDKSIGGIFPLIIYHGTNIIFNDNLNIDIYNKKIGWGNNQYYVNLLKKYFNLNFNTYYFPAGNFYILKNTIYNSIFGDSIIYNILNNQYSYDYHWCRIQYNKYELSYKNLYCLCKNRNLDLNYYQSYNGSRDYMIEHAFERIIFLFLYKNKLKIEVIDNDLNNLEKINIILNNLN